MILTYPSVPVVSAAPISGEDVQQWADEFHHLNQRFAPHFKRAETKQKANDVVRVSHANYITRLHRKTLCYSKSVVMLKHSLRLLLHYLKFADVPVPR